MPRPITVCKDPAHPDFPHGEPRGYLYGCHAGDPCPSNPTCADQHAASLRGHRRRGKSNPEEGRYRWAVRQRLLVTLNTITLEQLAEHTGLSQRKIKALKVENRAAPTMVPEDIAAPLDNAWAWFVHGSDVTTIREHGTPAAYIDGRCRCLKCRTHDSRKKKEYRVGIQTDKSHIPLGDLPEHVQALTRAAGTQRELARLTGVSESGLSNITRRSYPNVSIGVARKLRAHTPSRVAHARQIDPLVPMKRTLTLVRGLAALGYPRLWVNAQLADEDPTTPPVHPNLHNRQMVRLSTAKAVVRLVERVGDRPASPSRDGIYPEYVVARARDTAARKGWYPPMYYDDEGDLIARAIPDHPWAKVDERAANLLEGAQHLARGGTQAAAAKLIHCDTRSVTRNMKPLGLKYGPNPQDLDLRASRAAIRRVLDVYAAYEAGELGPVEAALTLGLLDAYNLLATHPEVAAWRQRQETAA